MRVAGRARRDLSPTRKVRQTGPALARPEQAGKLAYWGPGWYKTPPLRRPKRRLLIDLLKALHVPSMSGHRQAPDGGKQRFARK